jgi:hypothetical protein
VDVREGATGVGAAARLAHVEESKGKPEVVGARGPRVWGVNKAYPVTLWAEVPNGRLTEGLNSVSIVNWAFDQSDFLEVRLLPGPKISLECAIASIAGR